jgi:hypothetical protein
MSQRTFRLNSCAIAVSFENGHRTLVGIPAQAIVSVILGDLNGDGFVKVRYRNRVLMILADNLRRAEPTIASRA